MNKKILVIVTGVIVSVILAFFLWSRVVNSTSEPAVSNENSKQKEERIVSYVNESGELPEDENQSYYADKEDFLKSFLRAYYEADYIDANIENNYKDIKDFLAPEIREQFYRPDIVMNNPQEEAVPYHCSINYMGVYFEDTGKDYFRAVAFIEVVQSIGDTSPQNLSYVMGVNIVEENGSYIINEVSVNQRTRENYRPFM